MVALATQAPLRVLLGTDEQPGPRRGGGLPAALRERYGTDLSIPLVTGRPTVIGNFVSTLDGVVAFDVDGVTGGGEVSGFSEPDRFVMALLRALADVVMVGAGTVRADPNGRWVAQSVHRPSAFDTAALRAELGLAANPTTVVVTASGAVDLAAPGFADPAIPILLATTEQGRARLVASALPAHVEIVVAGSHRVEPRTLIGLLAARGIELVLCEGGPHLMAAIVAEHLLDELFLTVAPQIAGRDDGDHRLALIEGREFSVAEAPWAELVDVRSAGSHLFTRYRFTSNERNQ